MTTTRNIWLIVVGEPLHLEPDSRPFRTRLLATELAARGHRVTWWTSDFNHFAKRYHPAVDADVVTPEGYHLRFLHGRPYRRNLSIARQINHVQIARDFTRQARQLPEPDAIVCCLPSIELAAAAVRHGRAAGVPVIIDVRDLWPDEMVTRLPPALRPLGRVALTPVERVVRRTLAGASAVVGVSADYLRWGLDKAGRAEGPWDEVLPLGYPDHPDAQAVRRRLESSPGEAKRLFFSGSFNNSVDLDTLIQAVIALPDPALRLTICGRGDHDERWRAAAAADPRISFTGWVNAPELRRHAAASDVGMVCYRPESLVAMPNKLFEYMSFGLAIVNAIPGEAADLVDAEGIGVSYRAGSASDLADALQPLLGDPTRLGEMRQRAARLFEARYAINGINARYAALIERVIAAG